MTHWGKLRLTSWALAWIGLTGCSLLPGKTDPFTCTVTESYTKAGAVDTASYTVNRACLRGIQKRLDACYKE